MPGETILVVDDQTPVRQLFKRTLTGAGYRVLEARDGREAIEVFDRRGDEIDLLVTDMRMPVVDGAELIEDLRQRRQTLRILCISAFPPAEDHRCDGFLQKPFTNADFLARVRELVGRR